jgi:hypothetical protein
MPDLFLEGIRKVHHPNWVFYLLGILSILIGAFNGGCSGTRNEQSGFAKAPRSSYRAVTRVKLIGSPIRVQECKLDLFREN